jgi:hypothetical protein
LFVCTADESGVKKLCATELIRTFARRSLMRAF